MSERAGWAAVVVAAGIAGVVVGMAQNTALFAQPALTPYSLVQQHAPGVAILWSDDPALNCGAPRGGCFQPSYPNTIILSTDVTGDMLAYITLHEIAHVIQYRTAQPLDECAADLQALAWGANPAMPHYLPTPECEGERP